MSLDTFPSVLKESKIHTGRKTVSVIVVVWNAKKYVEECLTSLRTHCANVYTEVIVVDNASSDGTAELIEETFPEFKLIRNSENLGFARANNIGMEQSTGDFVCLVNSDVKFTSDAISPMLEYLGQHSEIGMVGPKMLAGDGTTVGRSTMRYPTLWNHFCRALGLDKAFKGSRIFGGLLMSDFNHQTTMPVEVLAGWFVLVRRSSLERVGLFDPQFFMYGEDVDWCYRFNLAGQKTVFFAEAEAIHYAGASSGKAPLRFYLEMYYANYQYWRKHHGRSSRGLFLASLALYHFVRLLGAAIAYVVRPSERQTYAAKFKRSKICLQWVSKPNIHPMDMGVDLSEFNGSSAKPILNYGSYLGRVRNNYLCKVHRRVAHLGDRGPIVTFTFDDFPRTAYSEGGAILERYGARGTFYLTSGLMHLSNELGELCSEEDVLRLLEHGHELGTQTFRHRSCRSVSFNAFRQDVEEGMRAVEHFAGHNSANFAYPYGHVTRRGKKVLGPMLTSSRSIIPGWNGPEVDLNLLRANRLYGDLEGSARVEDLLQKNTKQKTWLILYTHDVRLNPSEYGCTPALLDFAVSRAVTTGSRILTVQQVLAELEG